MGTMSLRPRTALGGAVAGVVLMLLTWLAAFHVAIVIRADHSILAGFAGLYRPTLDGPANFIAELCNPQPYVYLAAIPILVALARRRPRVAVMIGGVMLGANLSSQLLKPLLAEPRGDALGGPFINPGSWPSGHATAVMTLVLCAVIAAPARWRPAVAAVMSAFAIAVCFSFLILSWHYPSDVLGGFELATTWVLLGVAGLGWLEQRYPVTRPARDAPRRTQLSVAEALAPMAMLILLALVAAAVIALTRPTAVVGYASAHKWFILGAAVIAGLGVFLAGAATLALRRG
jgi:membrane-associated phospholipid phosphatase